MKLFRDKKVLLGKAVTTLCLLAVCFVGFSIMAKADTPGTVNDNNVNIRSAAGTDSVSLGKVNSGDKVTILEESNGWYKVTTAGGTTGFIKAEFITKSGDTTDNNKTPKNENPPKQGNPVPKDSHGKHSEPIILLKGTKIPFLTPVHTYLCNVPNGKVEN